MPKKTKHYARKIAKSDKSDFFDRLFCENPLTKGEESDKIYKLSDEGGEDAE
jgi:hypothetical protein